MKQGPKWNRFVFPMLFQCFHLIFQQDKNLLNPQVRRRFGRVLPAIVDVFCTEPTTNSNSRRLNATSIQCQAKTQHIVVLLKESGEG